MEEKIILNKKLTKRIALYFLVIQFIVLLTFTGCIGQNVQRYGAPNQPTPLPIPEATRLGTPGGSEITTAAERVIPSVVGIITTNVTRGRRTQGVGSGVIVDAAGYILTNNHVAGKDAERIVVSLYDGRDIEGRAVWADPVLDLSIVKITADNLQPALLGDSKTVRIGEQAIAIGNPLGLTFQRTVTAGIISAVNRTIEVSEGTFMEDLIQTDASINPGNSGGPLINVRGEVVGINTIKVTSAEAIGFAVPINFIKPAIDKLRSDGGFSTPSLGLQSLDKEMGRVYNFIVDKGVYVYDCKDGKCAFTAGVRKGDTILAVDGVEVNTSMELREALNRAGVGKNVRLRVRTPQGDEKEIDVVLDGEH